MTSTKEYASLKLPEQRIFVRDAPFLRRAVAFFADLFLLNIAVFGAFGQLFVSVEITSALAGSIPTAAYAGAITMALLALAYFALFEYTLSQTPGQMLLGMRVQNATLWRAVVRNSYLLPVFPFPVLWLIEPAHLIFRKTRFLEALTKTRTVEQITY